MCAGVVGGMPRRSRSNEPGAIQHIYARGVLGVAIFADELDRQRYLKLLRQVAAKHSWECLAHCLMTNHVHLLVKTHEDSLGAGMQALHGRYAQEFNLRHDRQGHLFQSRFGSTRIKDDLQMHAVTRYIARNPVEAGLCASPDDWPWTDCRRALAMIKGSDPGSDPLAWAEAA